MSGAETRNARRSMLRATSISIPICPLLRGGDGPLASHHQLRLNDPGAGNEDPLQIVEELAVQSPPVVWGRLAKPLSTVAQEALESDLLPSCGVSVRGRYGFLDQGERTVLVVCLQARVSSL